MNQVIVLLATVATATTLTAQTVKITGQIRERSELDAKSFVVGTPVDAFHLLRSRLAVNAAINDRLSATFELQDSRIFGQTRTVLNGDAPTFDVRQAVVEIREIADLPLTLKLGRQVLAYANERVIGKSDWSNVGQSFDAAVATVNSGRIGVDLIGAAIARNPHTGSYNRDVFLTGAWGSWKPADVAATVQAFYLFDTPRTDSLRRNRHTAGVYTNGTFAGFDYEIDGAIQFGDYIQEGEQSFERSIAASLVGARIGYTVTDLAGLRIGIGYDRLSGIDPGDGESDGTFSTLYGTNHKYYGHMDFVDNVAQTRGMGLQDIIGQISLAPLEALKLAADIHALSLATDPAELDPSLPENRSSQELGIELDMIATYKASEALSVVAGYSVFDGNRTRFLITGRKTVNWGYALVTVSF